MGFEVSGVNPSGKANNGKSATNNNTQQQKQELKLKISESQNLDEKFNYLSSMREIDEQILKLERSSNDTNR